MNFNIKKIFRPDRIRIDEEKTKFITLGDLKTRLDAAIKKYGRNMAFFFRDYDCKGYLSCVFNHAMANKKDIVICDLLDVTTDDFYTRTVKNIAEQVCRTNGITNPELVKVVENACMEVRKYTVSETDEWLKWNAQPKYIYFEHDEEDPSKSSIWYDNVQLREDYKKAMTTRKEN